MAVVQRQKVHRIDHQLGLYMVLALVTAALIAGGIALWQTRDDGTAPSAGAAVSTQELNSILTADEQIMVDLAVKGYIPLQAVDWETIATKRAVAHGFVPEQTLHPYFSAGFEPIFTQEELATIELVEKGLIPMQSVDWEEVELKRLANKGLIPRQAAP